MAALYKQGILLGFIISMATCRDVTNLDKQIVESNNKLAFKLYDAVKNSEGKDNIFMSPLSISSCMGMLYAMTNGSTAQEMSEVLQLPSDQDEAAAGFEQCLSGLDTKAVSLANSVFLSTNFDLKNSYIDVLNKHWSAAAERLNFSGKPKKSREHINNWVESKTNQMIKDLLPETFPEPNTAMVLVSALHFKRPWLAKFENAPEKGVFHLADGTKVAVDMIYAEDSTFSHKRMENIKADVLKIPYQGEKQSMVIIQPFEIDGLPAVEEHLKKLNFEKDILSGLHSGFDIIVNLPKFKLEDSFKLKSTFEKLGLKRVFDYTTADFSRGTESDNLEVSEIYHKTMIVVDEKGTEAAAATGIEMSVDMLPMTIEVNRPFVFAVTDTKTNLVLFLGRFTKPSEVN